MSDTKLRALERRWKETGTAEDEAAYLLERVRVGDLSRDRLERAAYCGYRAAQVALGPPGRNREENLGVWVMAHQVEAPWWDRTCLVQAAVTASSLTVPSAGEKERWTCALTTSRRWLDCPCDEHTEKARSLANSVGYERNVCSPVLEAAIESCAACFEPGPASPVNNSICCVVEALSGVAPGYQTAAERRAWSSSEALVRESIEAEIVRVSLLPSREESKLKGHPS